MHRWTVTAFCILAGVILAAGFIAPLAGIFWAARQGGQISTELVAVPPAGALLIRSLLLSGVATAGALALGILPAAVLGSARWSTAGVIWGFVLAPLLIPPQVYAYAWGLVTLPGGALGIASLTATSSSWVASSIRAGLISAGWLWPVVAMILAAGWRSSGRTVYTLAVLETTPTRAFLRAVIPSLRAYWLAAASLVFAITLLEYPIPHLALSRVYATELMILVDVGAPPAQIMRMAIQVIGLVLLLIIFTGASLSGIRKWDSATADDETAASRDVTGKQCGQPVRIAALAIWLVTLGLPVFVMWRSLRVKGSWWEGFQLFSREWTVSLAVALAVGAMSVILATGTAMLRAAHGRNDRGVISMAAASGIWLTLAGALLPAAVLGIGLILVFNRAGPLGDLYTETPVIWALALTARYGAVAVIIAWLTLGKRAVEGAEQARTDGAGVLDVLSRVLWPQMWRPILAGGLLVAILSLFEVVVSQLVRPVGYPSVALALLGQMHYGRDDVVITTSLLIVAAGVILTQICGWLLVRREA